MPSYPDNHGVLVCELSRSHWFATHEEQTTLWIKSFSCFHDFNSLIYTSRKKIQVLTVVSAHYSSQTAPLSKLFLVIAVGEPVAAASDTVRCLDIAATCLHVRHIALNTGTLSAI